MKQVQSQTTAKTTPRFTFVIPVYNRPDEIRELLESLCQQTDQDFDVVVVEDGSTVPCQLVCSEMAGRLSLHYYTKENSGPGPSRNYGVERAEGQYVIILDSDVVLPPTYLANVEQELSQHPVSLWGGPDSAHPSFTPMQKAISYSMTAFWTTGGIRGGKEKMERFHPRSFNMGVQRETYMQLHGFSSMRFGEDIDFSIRAMKAGVTCRLFPSAWVWHKRRTDLQKFWRQVFNSGIARIHLHKRHPGSLKLVHLLPMVFTLGVISMLLGIAIGLVWGAVGATISNPTMMEQGAFAALLCLSPLLLYALLVGSGATIAEKNVKVGCLSVAAAFTQLVGYGCGFLKAWWQRCVRGQGEFAAYEHNFYQ